MNVAIVQETVDIRRGGAETSTLEMANALVEQGAEVTVVARGGAGDVLTDDRRVTIHYIDTTGSRLLRSVRFVRAADEYCRHERFDIIHAVTPCLSASVYQPRGGTYGETVARNIALERHFWQRWMKRLDRRLNMRQRFLLLLERRLLCDERAPHVAAVSDYVRRQVERDYGVSPTRVRVIFNGAAITPLAEEQQPRARRNVGGALGVPAAAPLLLFVAHNFKLKGLRELLDALPHVGGHDAEGPPPVLLIIGRGDRRPYVRQVRRRRLTERVRFVDAVEDMRCYYAAAGLLVHPTWYDPCSRVVIEALRCGVPVVTTRHNGAAEMMEPGVHGEVVESPRDARALAAAIDRALAPAVAEACRAAAPAARERLSMARHARELLELYEEVRKGR